ncbi:hypothetical protein EJ06DRAFT_491996 [Trichodelitschia bisporula]|uniref:GATA-type domain-containing protein n=1 Tax=Trichodelitschia bisporula TaxID=703511 RepID=A0A6G1I183_9PEZI|nr:hypothetical protein EJ06DRAFT_491996 [Trichodelitschia bisporula]
MAAALANNQQPSCQNCATGTTPLWRRDENGSVLCNACGLFLKLHGRPRPISLKTDVIKSRNRVKTTGPGPRKKITAGDPAPPGLPAAHPDAASLDPARRAQFKPGEGRSASPVSRTGTPGLNGHTNIAPQHMFDSVSLSDPSFPSPSLPHFSFRHGSPSASSVNGAHLEPPPTYEGLLAQATGLKTRVSELEVINDLFRGRVTELEVSQAEARRAESGLRIERKEAAMREMELKRRVEELEAEVAEYRAEGPARKRLRVEDFVRDGSRSRGSSPGSGSGSTHSV